jgi:transcriptional regulator with XRE-family HTH domain
MEAFRRLFQFCLSIDISTYQRYYFVMKSLKILRRQKALSQREIAAIAGISTSTYNRVEKGLEEPMPNTMRKIAVALGVEPSDIKW